MNLLTLIQTGFETMVVKALLSTILIRLAAILFLASGLRARRAKAPAVDKDSVPAS
jgi:hypothetical protein